MNRSEWEKVFKTWTVQRFQDSLYAAPVTAAQLDAFEAESGFQLSSGYRNYAMVVGPGMLADRFRIATPSASDEGGDLMAKWRSKQKVSASHFGCDPSAELPDELKRYLRIVWFCSDFTGDEFGWDPQDPTPGRGRECGIYVNKRHEHATTHKVASTFDEFILEFCLGEKFWDIYPKLPRSPRSGNYPFSKPRNYFSPKSLGPKPPETSGVVSSPQHWRDVRIRMVIGECASPIGPPSTKAVADCERQSGFPLPKGYKEFLAEFGPGDFGGQFHIAAPGNDGLGPDVDLIACDASFPRDDWADYCDDPAQARRLKTFCHVTAKDWEEYVGWDPEDCRDVENHEYGIYLVSGSSCQFVAPSFAEFIETHLNFANVWDGFFLGPNYDSPIRKTFTPASAASPAAGKGAKKKKK